LQSSGEGKDASVLGCSQAATPNSAFTKAAWTTMSSPPIPFTCPFLIIAKASYPTRACYGLMSSLIQSKTAARQSTPMKDAARKGPLRPMRLIAGGDGAPFLQTCPQALDAVAIVIDPSGTGHGRLVFLGRDRRPRSQMN